MEENDFSLEIFDVHCLTLEILQGELWNGQGFVVGIKITRSARAEGAYQHGAEDGQEDYPPARTQTFDLPSPFPFHPFPLLPSRLGFYLLFSL